jgi:hypothetical protein
VNYVELSFEKADEVYAKAHDGGPDPENTRDYQDNTGYYRVWLSFRANLESGIERARRTGSGANFLRGCLKSSRPS